MEQFLTQEQRDTAFTIIIIYKKIREELAQIETTVRTLTERKDVLVKQLERTRDAERELIDSIKAGNPSGTFEIMDLLK